jgi:hypothetical protein
LQSQFKDHHGGINWGQHQWHNRILGSGLLIVSLQALQVDLNHPPIAAKL